VLFRSGAVAGVLAIADTLKADAADAVAELARRGIAVVMVTGDNRLTAEAIARQAGIGEVRAEVLPGEKANIIRALQKKKGARVAMVGDGINDAPALMQADVGMAIGAGTDIAIESSDVVFIGPRLGAVADALDIGGASTRKTVQNLCLAFFFNGLGVPLATTGLIHPAWAMIAMAFSVSAVLLNSFGGRMLKRREAPVRAIADSTGDKFIEITIAVPGIHCAACVETISANLALEDGVGRVSGDAKDKTITVAFDPALASTEKLRAAISAIGFEVA
jgi:cation transport ATPase